MTASRILVATEAHVLMGWLPSHVCVSQATLDYTVRRVSSGLFFPNVAGQCRLSVGSLVSKTIWSYIDHCLCSIGSII